MSAEELNESPTAPTTPLLEGTLLGGRYRIERYLGGGGMASVYRALHVGLDQPVAVKIVSPHVRAIPGNVSRFVREARAATRLKGEHVVRVFDVGTADDGSPYMVMELLEGEDLGAMLERGFRPSVEEAVDYILQACEALAEVHGLGIVHLDLKPANLFVTRGPDGLTCLKLIDFGISRAESPLTPKEPALEASPDVVMGSPRYMPPEQMECADTADFRSDIWGLGAILYEMLVGRAPFDGESLLDVYAAALRSPPTSPSHVRPSLPAGIDEVILACLRVEPSERPGDVAELAAGLAPFGDDDADARAESIARVLEVARVRGGLRAPDTVRTTNRTVSRIRSRSAGSIHSSRRRATALGALAVGILGAGLAARPLARRLDLVPSATGSTSPSAKEPRSRTETSTATHVPRPPAEPPPSPAIPPNVPSTKAAAQRAPAAAHWSPSSTLRSPPSSEERSVEGLPPSSARRPVDLPK